MEPPLDGTSDLGKVLDEAPLAQWNRIGRYDSEATCEARRNEAVKATMDEVVRMSKSWPLPSRDMWLGAARDRVLQRLVAASPLTTRASRRNRRGEGQYDPIVLVRRRPST